MIIIGLSYCILGVVCDTEIENWNTTFHLGCCNSLFLAPPQPICSVLSLPVTPSSSESLLHPYPCCTFLKLKCVTPYSFVDLPYNLLGPTEMWMDMTSKEMLYGRYPSLLSVMKIVHENSLPRAAPSARVPEWGDRAGAQSICNLEQSLSHRAGKPQLIPYRHIAQMAGSFCYCKLWQFWSLFLLSLSARTLSIYYRAHCSGLLSPVFCSMTRSPLWSAVSSPAITWQPLPSRSVFLCPWHTVFPLPGILLAAYQMITIL